MEVIRAEKMGFCFGVREAVELSEALSRKEKNKRIFMLGMLVHNEHVIEDLRNKGIEILEEETLLKNEDDLKEGDIVIIRAHGTIKEIYDRLEEKKVEVHDAACSFVTEIRNTLVEMEKKGYDIIFIGDKNHPEVKGIISFGERVYIFKDLNELIDSGIDKNGKYAVLTQTTLNKNNFEKVREYINNYFPNAEIFNKICGATFVRQKAAEKLAGEVDLVLVIGGKRSSNTRKLYDISKGINSNTYLIQEAKDICTDWLVGIEKIGITAGASTPEEIIIKIENKLRGIIDV
ncbi:4-hydroxy-3-methylbut-2-enyl diphosphate reductase [Ilyobacter polytropus]|uniref:4-hydroxy-3-methylbut-2-enyl diphosphate reductase n=1 Tax=Ilyobacter polytropus (strain ATCC 51220 / DSM 2926 / LMG 16218 / CuHBu1) TaxID=572544 RepID=E3HAA1_ILYPC|nr:4-hydroxy-3-methylbut-2-enyl diphosphate reductase [Ilyobacter polytropus]ADO83506.1 hydroxymethylbutenyl pyrophosphate reductase [Ilyobacter polytropus DSM 2926]